MKGDDDESAAWRQQAFGGRETSFELAELVVHVQAQRHEGARGRIDSVACPRHGATDDFGELTGAGDRRPAPRLDDGAGDATRPPFLAERVENVGQRRIVERRSEEHTSELQSLMRISNAGFGMKK